MRLIFFGTAAAVQTARDGNVCFALASEGSSLLVDASGSPAQNLSRAGIDPLALEALALTHAHTDHLYALPSLLHCLRLAGRKRPLKILCSPATAARAWALCAALELLQKPGIFPISWITAEEAETRLEDGMAVRLFPVAHSIPTSGVKVARDSSVLVYSADTAPCPRLTEETRGAAVLVHEATGPVSMEEALNRDGHSSGRQAGLLAREAGVQALYLCHFDYQRHSPSEAELEAAAAFKGAVIIPELFSAYEI